MEPRAVAFVDQVAKYGWFHGGLMKQQSQVLSMSDWGAPAGEGSSRPPGAGVTGQRRGRWDARTDQAAVQAGRLGPTGTPLWADPFCVEEKHPRPTALRGWCPRSVLMVCPQCFAKGASRLLLGSSCRRSVRCNQVAVTGILSNCGTFQADAEAEYLTCSRSASAGGGRRWAVAPPPRLGKPVLAASCPSSVLFSWQLVVF